MDHKNGRKRFGRPTVIDKQCSRICVFLFCEEQIGSLFQKPRN